MCEMPRKVGGKWEKQTQIKVERTKTRRKEAR